MLHRYYNELKEYYHELNEKYNEILRQGCYCRDYDRHDRHDQQMQHKPPQKELDDFFSQVSTKANKHGFVPTLHPNKNKKRKSFPFFEFPDDMLLHNHLLKKHIREFAMAMTPFVNAVGTIPQKNMRKLVEAFCGKDNTLPFITVNESDRYDVIVEKTYNLINDYANRFEAMYKVPCVQEMPELAQSISYTVTQLTRILGEVRAS
jgi:hypothetical protein